MNIGQKSGQIAAIPSVSMVIYESNNDTCVFEPYLFFFWFPN